MNLRTAKEIANFDTNKQQKEDKQTQTDEYIYTCVPAGNVSIGFHATWRYAQIAEIPTSIRTLKPIE